MCRFFKKRKQISYVIKSTALLIPLLSLDQAFHTDNLPGRLLFATDKPNQTEECLPSTEYGSLAQPTGTENPNLFWGVVCILLLSLTRMRSFFGSDVMTQTQLSFFLSQKAAHSHMGHKQSQRTLFEESDSRRLRLVPVRELRTPVCFTWDQMMCFLWLIETLALLFHWHPLQSMQPVCTHAAIKSIWCSSWS